MSQTIIVHGGAHQIPPEEAAEHRAGCLAAAERGWEVLSRGGSAVDAVEAAIRALETDGTFNAGYGSTLNPDGVVRMDAGIMDGREAAVGAVGCIEGLRHPISLGRRLLSEKTVLMVGDLARRFAGEQGLELCAPEALISPKQREKWEAAQQPPEGRNASNDTVGCVALDRFGNIAAGASTGGTGDHPPGRVGDSPLAGSGFHAENGVGGSSFTGVGEGIIRITGARSARDLMAAGAHPEVAAAQVIRTLKEVTGATGGCILVDREGRVGWAHNEPNIAIAYRTAELNKACVFLQKSEE